MDKGEGEERIYKNPFAACNLQVTDENVQVVIKQRSGELIKKASFK